MPIVSATPETETGGLPELISLGPAYVHGEASCLVKKTGQNFKIGQGHFTKGTP